MDPKELEFSFSSPAGFEDVETGEQIPVIPDRLRREYGLLVADHVDILRKTLTDRRVDYTLLDTSRPLDHALFRYLLARERMSKTR
jgi:hypothetical protein